jgi:hypothetical protein
MNNGDDNSCYSSSSNPNLDRTCRTGRFCAVFSLFAVPTAPLFFQSSPKHYDCPPFAAEMSSKTICFFHGHGAACVLHGFRILRNFDSSSQPGSVNNEISSGAISCSREFSHSPNISKHARGAKRATISVNTAIYLDLACLTGFRALLYTQSKSHTCQPLESTQLVRSTSRESPQSARMP